MTVNIDFLLAAFSFISLYYVVMAILALKKRKTPIADPDLKAFGYVILIPAHNEEMVIAETVLSMTKLPGRCHVVIIDDGSKDLTPEMVQPYLCDNVHLFQRVKPNAGKGKGAALNAAYRYALSNVGEWFPDLSEDQIAIGVTDADVYVAPAIIAEVTAMFQTCDYGAVQAPVAIRGASKNPWLLMQDMEFMSYFYVIQRARHHISSVAMGGNGQFIRLSAMRKLGDIPWTDCLTEDIDIGMRLIACNETIAFTGATPVVQHGLTNVRSLVKQRTRWVQGHYQVWRRIPEIWASKAKLVTKTDATLYLLMILMPWVLLTDYSFGVLSAFGAVHITSGWLQTMGNANPYLPNAFQLLLSFSIQLFLLPTYFRVTRVKAPWYTIPGIAVLFAIYAAGIWIVASILAMWRIARRKRNWTKTERENVSVGIGSAV